MKALECSQHNTLILQTFKGRLKFELIQSFRHGMAFCKNEDDPIKNEAARVLTTFSSLLVYGDFSNCSRAVNSAVLGPIWPNFALIRDILTVLVTCKNKKIKSKINKGA